jgi:hypothetical protein
MSCLIVKTRRDVSPIKYYTYKIPLYFNERHYILLIGFPSYVYDLFMFRFTNHNSHFFMFILTNKNDKKLTIQKLVVTTNKQGPSPWY